MSVPLKSHNFRTKGPNEAQSQMFPNVLAFILVDVILEAKLAKPQASLTLSNSHVSLTEMLKFTPLSLMNYGR